MSTELEKLEEQAEKSGGSARTENEDRQVMMKLYHFPEWATMKSFIMRELFAPDQLTARVMADQRRSSKLAADNIYGLMTIEQFETMRLAFVKVDDDFVNTPELPYQGLDTWSLKELRFAHKAYEDLNGVEEKDLENFTATSEVITQADLTAKSGPGNGSLPATEI